MTITKYITKSIQFIMKGFACIAQNPILFVYPFIFLSIPAIIVVSRYFNIPSTHNPAYAYHLIRHMGAASLLSLLLIIMFAILLTFVAACIAIHTFAILTHKPITIAKTLKKLFHHAKHLALWSVITTILVYTGLVLLDVLHEQWHDFSWSTRVLKILHFGVDVAWAYITFFVLQIHALEECSLLESLKRSVLLAKKVILQAVAIRLVYTLALYLALHKGLIWFMLTLEQSYPLQDNYRNLIEGSIESILLMFFFTVYMVFTTKLYYEHVKEIGK